MFEKRAKTHHRDSLFSQKIATQIDLENLLQNSQPTDGALYIHIPFCDNICSFCSMNRTKLKDELDEYCEFILSQIDKIKNYPYIQSKTFQSVYFGGGTPTILKINHLEKIISSINKNLNLSSNIEFSLESTIHNLSLEKLKMLSNLGVNRFSIGVQTFNSCGRKFFGRVYNQERALEKLSAIRENFSGNLCIDIIYNYPNQSVDDVLQDAKFIKQLNIDSVSFYSLIYMDSSNLSKQIKEHYDLKTDRTLHNAFLNFMLKNLDFEVLEHTKIVKRHRDKYHYIKLTHECKDIVPLGVGSGGKIGNFKIFNQAKDKKIIIFYDKAQKEFDKFMNLFQYPNISLSKIEKFLNSENFENLLKFYKSLQKHNLVTIEDDLLKYSIDGIFWGNTIADEIYQITKNYFKGIK